MLLWRGVILGCLAFSTCANATPPQDFQDWWARVTAGGENGPSIDGVGLAFEVQSVYIPSDAELAAMRQRVEGHPQHLEAFNLAEFERRRAGKFPTYKYEIWRWAGAGGSTLPILVVHSPIT